jgi:dTMP kinase
VGFVAVASLVTTLVDSPAAKSYAVAGVMIARMAPAVLFGPFAGAIVDRLDRKQIMITADIARGSMYATMPVLAIAWGLGAVIVISFAIECLSLLWTPARDASLPNLVPRRQLANANSFGLITTYGTLPLGGAIFAVLAGIASGLGGRVPFFQDNPESLALWLDAGTFLFSAIMVAGVPIRTPAREDVSRLDLRRFGSDIVEGVRFLLSHSLASRMTMGIVVAFSAVGAVLALGPVFTQSVLSAGAAGWGVLVTAFGIGMGIGLVSVNRITRVIERELLFPLSMIAAGGTLIVLAAMPTLETAAALTVLLGLAVGGTWVSGYVLLQENVADEYRGRTFGSLTVMARLGLFLSLALFPVLAGALGSSDFHIGGQRIDLSGTRLALWVAGVGVILAGGVTRRGLRQYRLGRAFRLGLIPRLKRPPGKGLFVAFEGVEGSGKGTQIRLAQEYLESKGMDVVVTREPGGTGIGERLRSVLLDPRTGRLEPRTEALLFAASRAQLVSSLIRPALAEGKVVICDRFVDSSVAYQGFARGLGEQDVLTLSVWATQGLFPDLTILLHVEPEIGLGRVGEDTDRIESEGVEFLAKVADAYLRIAEDHPERFVVVDASRSPDEVHRDVAAALDKLVREREGLGDD